jgi:hypothetical protein
MTLPTANTILNNVADDDYRSFDIAVALAIRVMQSQIEDLHKQLAEARING